MKTKENKKQRLLLNFLMILFFFAGTYLIAKPHIYDYLNQQKAEKALAFIKSEKNDSLDLKKDNLQQNEALYSGADVENISKETYQKADTKKIIMDYGIGNIDFVEQKITIPVVEGVTNEALLVGAGTLKPFQEVGKGNFSLAGHRLSTKQSLLFSHIPELNRGDHVNLSIGSHSGTYIIEGKQIIEPTETQYIEDAKGDGLLSLICCTDDGKKRWLITGTIER